tara:strand:+ start:990 stop:1316 length:327 start_codon:yes stop_codon:yes gene_type:complete
MFQYPRPSTLAEAIEQINHLIKNGTVTVINNSNLEIMPNSKVHSAELYTMQDLFWENETVIVPAEQIEPSLPAAKESMVNGALAVLKTIKEPNDAVLSAIKLLSLSIS